MVATSETKVKDTTNDGLYVDTDIELGDDGETISYSSGQAHSSSSSKDENGHTAPDLTNFNSVNSFGGINKARSLEWNVLKYNVKLKKGKKLTVLRNIAGKAENGTFNAILGPSGCGKTSLLDCLALRNKDFKGGLALDGKPLTSEFFLNTGYVHQKEVFFHHLTVREHLIFHAVNRLSHVRTRAECDARVEQVMEEVDVSKVANSRIGGGELTLVKGLSGGERKRLNIATELLADPSILLLDEPTSGLDSVMGELICLLLKTIAVRGFQRIVITSIHTPSSRLFSLFSNITLLTSNGELAYFGPRAKILSWLEGLGFPCPALFNPADFILELASTRVIQGQAGAEGSNGLTAGQFDVPKEVNGTLLVESHSSPVIVAACANQLMLDFPKIAADNSHKDVMGVKGSKTNLLVSFKMNLWRSWLMEKREYLGMAVGIVMNIILGLVFGILYFQKMPTDNGRNTAGFLFSMLVTLLISSSIAVCLYFPFDFAILMREYYSGANMPGPYFVGRTFASMPPSLMFLLMGIIPYWMVGLSVDAKSFGMYVLILFIFNTAAQSIGYLASSFSSNPVVGLSILPLLATPSILFSGMLLQRSSVSVWLEWLQGISVMNYAFGLLTLNQVDHVSEGTRKFLLDFLEIKPSQFHSFLITLTFLAVGYRLVAMCVLIIRVRFLSKSI